MDRELLLAHGRMHLTAGRSAIFCLHGGAGVGKSAAAVRLGHLVAADLDQGRTRWRAVTLFDLATSLVEAGRLAAAAPVIQEAKEIFDEVGDTFGSAYVDVVEARHAVRLGKWAKARKLLDAASQRFLAIDDVSSLCEVRLADAELLLARNHPAAARELLLATIDDALSVDDSRSAHQCRQLLGTFTV